MLTKQFWLATLERAAKTAAQTGISVLAISQTGLIGVDWSGTASVIGLATILSVLTSIASSGGSSDGPSAIGAEKLVYTPYSPKE